jgi:hypothetical protein
LRHYWAGTLLIKKQKKRWQRFSVLPWSHAPSARGTRPQAPTLSKQGGECRGLICFLGFICNLIQNGLLKIVRYCRARLYHKNFQEKPRARSIPSAQVAAVKSERSAQGENFSKAFARDTQKNKETQTPILLETPAPGLTPYQKEGTPDVSRTQTNRYLIS